MRNASQILMIGALTLLMSCQSKEYILPARTPLLVINGVLQANQPARIYIGRSWSPTESVPVPHFISNALAILKNEGRIVDTLKHQSNGIYVGRVGRNLIAGSAYSIQVSVPNYETASSNSVRVPHPFPLNRVLLDKNTPVLGLNGTNADPVLLETILGNVRDSDEYYGISIRPMYQKYRLGTAITVAGLGNQTFNNECFVSTNLPRDVQSASPYQSAFFFKTSCVTNQQGERISLVAETKGGVILDNGSFQQVAADRFEITLINSTAEYPLNRQSLQGPEGLESAFVEPRLTYSNVNNGFGIVSGFNSQTLIVFNK
jgi:hypothetical protein